MKRATVFANGNLSDISQAKKIIGRNDYIVCADGGVEKVLKMGLVPHVVIGDFDSLSKTIKKKLFSRKVELIKYPVKKDKTDFELVMDYVIKKRFNEIIVFGLLGDRLDHFLANIFLLTKIFSQNKSLKLKIIEGNQVLFFVNRKFVLQGEAGDMVSLIPLTNDVQNILTEGLEYKLLANESLLYGQSRGVSNVMTKKKATIVFKKGILLVIHSKKHS